MTNTNTTETCCQLPFKNNHQGIPYLSVKVSKGARSVWATRTDTGRSGAMVGGVEVDVLANTVRSNSVRLEADDLHVRADVRVVLRDTERTRIAFKATITAIRCFVNTQNGAEPVLVPNVNGRPDLSQPIEIIECVIKTHARNKSLVLRVYPETTATVKND